MTIILISRGFPRVIFRHKSPVHPPFEDFAGPTIYVQGVSARKVCDILVKLVGPAVSISSTQVSRAAQKLDAGLATWPILVT